MFSITGQRACLEPVAFVDSCLVVRQCRTLCRSGSDRGRRHCHRLPGFAGVGTGCLPQPDGTGDRGGRPRGDLGTQLPRLGDRRLGRALRGGCAGTDQYPHEGRRGGRYPGAQPGAGAVDARGISGAGLPGHAGAATSGQPGTAGGVRYTAAAVGQRPGLGRFSRQGRVCQ
ncbi:hypothetical protein D3C80_631960 [compost metagenome]